MVAKLQLDTGQEVLVKCNSVKQLSTAYWHALLCDQDLEVRKASGAKLRLAPLEIASLDELELLEV